MEEEIMFTKEAKYYKIIDKKQKHLQVYQSLDYTMMTNQRYTGRVNLGDPGRKNIPRTSYQSGIGEATDKINALPIYRGKNIDRV